MVRGEVIIMAIAVAKGLPRRTEGLPRSIMAVSNDTDNVFSPLQFYWFWSLTSGVGLPSLLDLLTSKHETAP